MATTIAYAHIAYDRTGGSLCGGDKNEGQADRLDHIAYRWSAEDIQRNHPYLTLSQIHSALAYYYDHQREIDDAIEEGLRTVETIKTAQGESPLRHRLRAYGDLS